MSDFDFRARIHSRRAATVQAIFGSLLRMEGDILLVVRERAEADAIMAELRRSIEAASRGGAGVDVEQLLRCVRQRVTSELASSDFISTGQLPRPAAFAAEQMGQFDLEKQRHQHDLWVCYHFVTERFDRTACTGPIRDDSIMPANEYERAVINVHSSGVRQVALERGAEWPIGGMVQRLSFAELGAIAEKYPEICDAMVARGRSTVEAWWRRRRGGP